MRCHLFFIRIKSFIWVLYFIVGHLGCLVDVPWPMGAIPPKDLLCRVGFFPVQPCSRVLFLEWAFVVLLLVCALHPSLRSAGVGLCAWVSSMCVEFSAAEI